MRRTRWLLVPALGFLLLMPLLALASTLDDPYTNPEGRKYPVPQIQRFFAVRHPDAGPLSLPFPTAVPYSPLSTNGSGRSEGSGLFDGVAGMSSQSSSGAFQSGTGVPTSREFVEALKDRVRLARRQLDGEVVDHAAELLSRHRDRGPPVRPGQIPQKLLEHVPRGDRA